MGRGASQQGWPGRLLSVASAAGVCVSAWNTQHLAGPQVQPGHLLGLWGPGHGGGPGPFSEACRRSRSSVPFAPLSATWLSGLQSPHPPTQWTVSPRGWDAGHLAFFEVPDPGRAALCECSNE